jgi:hypothetical protein
LRVLLSCSGDPSSWVVSENRPVLKESVSNRLKQCVLFHDQWKLLYDNLGSLPQHQSLLLADLLRKSVTISFSPSNAEVRLNPPRTISDLYEDPLFLSSFTNHTKQADVKEAREVFFDRTIGHLARFAKEMHIHDRYAFENLNWGPTSDPDLQNIRSGINWVIWEKLSKLPIKLVVHTALPWFKATEQNVQRGGEVDKLSNYVRNAIRQGLATAHENFQFELLLYTLAEDKAAGTDDPGRHDRFGRFEFERESISFDMSKGLEIFKGLHIGEPHKIQHLDSDEFDKKQEAWKVNSEVVEFFSNR